MSKQKPEWSKRSGRCVCSVFVNTSEREEGGETVEREFRSISLQRSYVDEKGNRQYTGSLGEGDIPNAVHLLQGALEHCDAQRTGTME